MSSTKGSIEVKTSPSLPSPTQDDFAVDPAVERRILRKLDFKVVPALCFLFFISFIDRGNIGNAKIQGMTATLKMKGNDYNVAVLLFTVAYIVFGLPANIVFKKTGPKSLSVMMFLWGICALCQGLVNTPAQMKALRFLMGVFESGFVPGCAYLIGSYYTKDEFLKRYAVFFSMAIIAGAFNGLLATLFSKMHGVGGYAGWRWIFIMEGLITIVVSVLSVFVIVPFPEQNKSFTAEEKSVILARIARDGIQEDESEKGWRRVVTACSDVKVWLAILVYFGAEENASGVVAFQPTVLKGLGYTSTGAQVHSIPIYATAFVIMLCCAFTSERLRQRYVFVIVGGLFNIVGLAIELAQPKAVGARYAGMFFLTTGSYIVMPLTVVWLAINVGKGFKRTAALGLLIPVGNCGAILSSNVFITSESPKYHTGFAVGMSMNMLSMVAATVLYGYLRWENSKKDKLTPEALHERVNGEGELNPDFRYSL
ncbi:hypothetical protein MBLNU459_g6016t1 [Dothideomycetes sp. NU459]